MEAKWLCGQVELDSWGPTFGRTCYASVMVFQDGSQSVERVSCICMGSMLISKWKLNAKESQNPTGNTRERLKGSREKKLPNRSRFVMFASISVFELICAVAAAHSILWGVSGPMYLPHPCIGWGHALHDGRNRRVLQDTKWSPWFASTSVSGPFFWFWSQILRGASLIETLYK